MGSTYRPDDDEIGPRRRTPRRRRGLADAIDELGATSLLDLGGEVDLAPPPPRPRAALPSLEPEAQEFARSRAEEQRGSRPLGVESEFVAVPRPAPKPPRAIDLLNAAKQRPDATTTATTEQFRPKAEGRGETEFYRDPMAVAESRAQLRQIAMGKAKRPDGTDYSPEERERAAALDVNLGARIDREEAKGGFGRRALNAFALGGVNAPLERDINEARREGNVVTEDDLRSLDVRTREGKTLRTEATLGESAREEMLPSLVGELPYYMLGPIAAEGRALVRGGEMLARRGGTARTIGDALARVGRDEIVAPTFLERTGQRAVRGAIQGQVPGAAVSVARGANEGRSPEEIAAGLPLELAIGGAAGAVIDPLMGAAGEAIRGVSRRMRGLGDMEIPTPGVRASQPEPVDPVEASLARGAAAADRMGASRPSEQANAVNQMLADMEIETAVKESEAYRQQQAERAAVEEQETIRTEPAPAALSRMTELAKAGAEDDPAAEVARQYRQAIDSYIDAAVEAQNAPEEHRGPGTKLDLKLSRAMIALGDARRAYGQQVGAASILALAEAQDDLTDDEKAAVGLASVALVPFGKGKPSRTALRALDAMAQYREKWKGMIATPVQWASNIVGWGGLNDLDAERVRKAVYGILAEPTDANVRQINVSFDEVERAIAGMEDVQETGRAPLRSRLIDAIETLPGAWDKERPAADWIGKLKGTNTISKAELSMILPVLEEAQRQKKKVVRSEILTLANRLAPEIEQVTLQDAGRLSRASAEAGDAEGIDDIDAIEADYLGADGRVRAEFHDVNPEYIQEQIDNRAARVREIEEDIERQVDNANDEIRDAEQEERRAVESFRDTLESAGMSTRAIERVESIVNDNVESEYIPRDLVDKAMQEAIDELAPDADALREMFADNGYKVSHKRELIIKDAEGDEIDRIYMLPGETQEQAEKAWLHDNATGEEIEQKVHTFEVEEDENEFIAFDANGDKAGEGMDEDNAIADAVSQNDLDTEWRDEKWGEVRDAIGSLADARAEYLRRESEAYYIAHYDEYDGGPFENEIEEMDRLRDDEVPRLQQLLTQVQIAAAQRRPPTLTERTMQALGITRRDERALEAEGQQTLLPAEAGAPGEGRPEGEPVAIVPAPTTDLNPATNPFLMPLAPTVKGKPQYATFQRIGGNRGRNYRELVNRWVNPPPGTEFRSGHYSRSAQIPDDVGHVRAEDWDVFMAPHRTAPGMIPHTPGEPKETRHLIDAINTKRKERDKKHEAMAALVREHEALPANEKEGPRAHNLATQYRELNQHVIDISNREAELLNELDDALGIERGLPGEPFDPDAPNRIIPTTVAVMVESQSDWAQKAYEDGVRLTDEQQARRLKEIEPERERLRQAKVQAADRDRGAVRALNGDANEIRVRLEALEPDHADVTVPAGLRAFPKDWRSWGDPSKHAIREWYIQRDPALKAVFEQFDARVNEAAEFARQVSRADEAFQKFEEEVYYPVYNNAGVSASPFIGEKGDANTPYVLNAARFLIDSAERGYEQIAWSDAANRVKNAHLPLSAAQNVYDKYTPAAMQKLLAGLGFKDVKPEKLYINGEGHWTIKLTPEMRVAIRRVGFPVLGILAMMAAPGEAQAQDGKQAKESNGKFWLGTAAGSALTVAALVGLARRRAARLMVAQNPALKNAVVQAYRALPEPARRQLARPDFAYRRMEPMGTEYDAPIDVTETPSRKGAAQFNVAKIGLSPEGEGVWRHIVEDLALKKRHVSWDETQAEADRRSTDIDAILHEKPWRGTDALAARLFQSQASERLVELAKELGKPLNTPDQKLAVQAEMDRLATDIADVAARAAGEREAAGRTLNAYKIVARSTLDAGTWQTLAQRAKGELPLTADEILKIQGFVSRRDREALTSFVASLHTSSTLDKVLTLWKAGLLTAFPTHAVNAMSNAVEAATVAATQPLAVAVDAIIALVRGTEREKALPKGLIASRMKGFVKGMGEAKRVFKTGIRPEEAGKWDVRRTNFKSPILQAYTDLVFNTLAAGDRPFYRAALDASMDELTTIYARRAVRADPSLKFEDVKQALLDQPPTEIEARAGAEALRATFQNDGTLARMASGIRQATADKPVARGAFEAVAPFTKTPSNVASRFVDTSPLGLVTAILRQVNAGEFDQRRFSEDIARAMVGTGGLMLLGYMLAERGEATGSAPTNPSEREVWKSLGKQAHSVKLGDRWYNVARLGPAGMTIAAGAQFRALMQENPGEASKLVGGMAGTVGRVMLDQSFLLGASRALETVADPLRRGESFTAGLAGSLVPAMAGRIAQASDDTRREAITPGERIRSRVPIVSRGLRPQLNVFGDEMKRSKTDRAAAMVDPLFSVREQDEPILKEIERLGVGVPTIPKTRKLTDPEDGARFEVRFSDEERHAALSLIGPKRRQFLERLVFSDAFANMPDQVRAKEIRKALDAADEEYYARDDRLRIAERRKSAAAPPQP